MRSVRRPWRWHAPATGGQGIRAGVRFTAGPHGTPGAFIRLPVRGSEPAQAGVSAKTGFSGRNRVWLKFTASEDEPHAPTAVFRSSFPRERESMPPGSAGVSPASQCPVADLRSACGRDAIALWSKSGRSFTLPARSGRSFFRRRRAGSLGARRTRARLVRLPASANPCCTRSPYRGPERCSYASPPRRKVYDEMDRTVRSGIGRHRRTAGPRRDRVVVQG